MSNESTWNNNYRQNQQNLPWCLNQIPDWFQIAVKSIEPCKALDIGCGVGNYAYYLSQQGFQVTAIDYSIEAIRIAKEKYPCKNPQFRVMDALNLGTIQESFDFAYEVSLFHHINPEYRKKYAQGIAQILHSNASFFLTCFSDVDSTFKGERYFNPETKTIMYPVSLDAITESFVDSFTIEEITTIYFGKDDLRKQTPRHFLRMARK